MCCLVVIHPPREHRRPSNHVWHNSLPIIPFTFIFMMSLSLSPLLYESQTQWREGRRAEEKAREG